MDFDPPPPDMNYKQNPDDSVSQVMCPTGHPLVQKYQVYHCNNYQCDFCGKSLNAKIYPAANCTTCDFDLCPSCFKNQQSSLLRCEDGHHLYKTLFRCLAGKIPFPFEDYVCQSCHEYFGTKENPCTGCKICGFYLCPGCYEKQEMIFLCPNDHPVSQVTEYRTIDPESKNLYECTVCKKYRKSEMNPAMHCSDCKFDCCPGCFEKYQIERRAQEKEKIRVQLIENGAEAGTGNNKPRVVWTIKKKGSPVKIEPKETKEIAEETKAEGNSEIKDKEEGKEEDKMKKLMLKKQAELDKKRGKTDKMEKEKVKEEEAEKKSEGLWTIKEQVEAYTKKINEDKNICKGCLQTEKTHLLIPCGHICVCDKCSRGIVKRKENCPECKKQVEKRVRMY